MSTYLLAATPARGHVVPLLGIASHFVASGHRVLFMTGQRYADEVGATGAEFLALPAAAEIDFDDLHNAYPERENLRGVAALRYDIITLFVRPGAAQYVALRTVLEAEHIDAIVAEPTFTGAALVWGLPRAQRPPVVGVGIAPLGVKSRDTAPFGLGILPKQGTIGRLRNAALYFLTESVLFAPVKRESDAIARATIGHTHDGPVLDWTAQTDAVAQLTVPGFEYPRSDLPAHIHFLGPVSQPNAEGELPSWWADLLAPGRVVHVTQGTVANDDFDRLIIPTCIALADENVLVVVSTGGRDPKALPPLPENVRVARYLPYDQLLPLVDVLVTNGGYGGVQQALSYGVPLVVAGRSEDKVEVSARVQWSGVGVNLKTETPTSAQVRTAVREVLDDLSFRTRAETVRAEMRQSPGLAGLDRLLETLQTASSSS